MESVQNGDVSEWSQPSFPLKLSLCCLYLLNSQINILYQKCLTSLWCAACKAAFTGFLRGTWRHQGRWSLCVTFVPVTCSSDLLTHREWVIRILPWRQAGDVSVWRRQLMMHDGGREDASVRMHADVTPPSVPKRVTSVRAFNLKFRIKNCLIRLNMFYLFFLNWNQCPNYFTVMDNIKAHHKVPWVLYAGVWIYNR